MPLPYDYDLSIANNNRAYWDAVAGGGPIQVMGNGGHVTIRARLQMPPLTVAQLARIAEFVNVIVIPVGDDGNSVDWSLADFALDADGYLYFDLYNFTAIQEEGGYLVMVDRVTWSV